MPPQGEQQVERKPETVNGVPVGFCDGRCEATINVGVCERVRKGIVRELNKLAEPFALHLEIFVDEKGHHGIRFKPHRKGHSYQRTFRELVKSFVEAYAPRLKPEAFAAS